MSKVREKEMGRHTRATETWRHVPRWVRGELPVSWFIHPGQGRGHNNPEMKEVVGATKWRGDLMNRIQLVREQIEKEEKEGETRSSGDKLISMTWRG